MKGYSLLIGQIAPEFHTLDIRSSDDKFVYVENLSDSILYVTQPLINKKEKNKVTPVIQ